MRRVGVAAVMLAVFAIPGVAAAEEAPFSIGAEPAWTLLGGVTTGGTVALADRGALVGGELRIAIAGMLAIASVLNPQAAGAVETPAAQPPPPPVLPASEILWPLLQLVPSPEIAFGNGRASGGLRWEVSPFLYSFGLRTPRTRVHAFFVPPPARFTGSFELVGSAEYAPGPPETGDWVGRLGGRVTLPLVDRGEALALSVGTAAFLNDGHVRPSFDVGLLTFFGTFGVRATFSPELAGRQAIVTLALRFF